MSTASAGPLAAAASAGSPAVNAWITNGTRSRIQRTSLSGSCPWSCTPCRPTLATIVDDPFRALVAEHADGRDAVRQPAGDVANVGGLHLPDARREHEAEGVGPDGRREQGVVRGRDPADLDEHAATLRVRRAGRDSDGGHRGHERRGIGRPHERLPHEHRVEPDLGHPLRVLDRAHRALGHPYHDRRARARRGARRRRGPRRRSAGSGC